MTIDESWQNHLEAYKAADALYRAGNLKTAKAAFFRALELAPSDMDTLWAIGDCYSEIGMPGKAERYFRRALANAEWASRGDLVYNIANALLDQGRNREAIRLFKLVPRRAASFMLARRNVHFAVRKIADLALKL